MGQRANGARRERRGEELSHGEELSDSSPRLKNEKLKTVTVSRVATKRGCCLERRSRSRVAPGEKKRTFDEAASTQIAATATSEKRPIEKALCWGLSKKKKASHEKEL